FVLEAGEGEGDEALDGLALAERGGGLVDGGKELSSFLEEGASGVAEAVGGEGLPVRLEAEGLPGEMGGEEIAEAHAREAGLSPGSEDGLTQGLRIEAGRLEVVRDGLDRIEGGGGLLELGEG